MKLSIGTVQKLFREVRMPVANMATVRNFESVTTRLHLKNMLKQFVHTTEMKRSETILAVLWDMLFVAQNWFRGFTIAAASYVMFIDCCVHELYTSEYKSSCGVAHTGCEVKICCLMKLWDGWACFDGRKETVSNL